MTETYYLDAPSLVYRAFFSLPTTVTDAEGNAVNAVRGFMEMITRIVIDRRPQEIVAVFDADMRPTFRVEAYPGYKAERPEASPELPAQFDVIAQVLDAAGIPSAEAEGLEADDVIATFVKDASAEQPAVVVSGDRDMLALVRDGAVRVLFPKRGTKEMTEFDEASVERAYGVPPRLYPAFATLRGDPSDGLPGIPGIGPKRAAALLQEHGSIDEVVAHAHTLPPKQRAAFADSADYLDAMKTVVRLVDDADILIRGGGALDGERLDELSVTHNLGSSGARLAQALRSER